MYDNLVERICQTDKNFINNFVTFVFKFMFKSTNEVIGVFEFENIFLKKY